MKFTLLCLAFHLPNYYNVFISSHPSRPSSISLLTAAMKSKCGPYTVASASPENLLEIQILELHHPRTTESETLGAELSTLF